MTLEELELEMHRGADARNLVKEAAAVDNRAIPLATVEWYDLRLRRHIAPWTQEPDKRKHEAHGLQCWCKPTLYQDVLIHWDEQPPQDETMNWTTEYPTQPGYYWIRNYAIQCRPEQDPNVSIAPQLVELYPDALDELYWIGNDAALRQRYLVSAEWFGPIQPPLELSECLVGGHPPDCRSHIQSPQENCYLDEDGIAVHKNGCIGDKCQLGHIQASIIEL